jgi:hypothetical protein
MMIDHLDHLDLLDPPTITQPFSSLTTPIRSSIKRSSAYHDRNPGIWRLDSYIAISRGHTKQSTVQFPREFHVYLLIFAATHHLSGLSPKHLQLYSGMAISPFDLLTSNTTTSDHRTTIFPGFRTFDFGNQ